MHEKQFERAIACYEKALALRTDYAEIHSNIGKALMELGRYEESISWYRKALALDPDAVGVEAVDCLMFARSYQNDFTPDLYLAEARRYGEMVMAKARPYQHWIADPAAQALRVGMVSADFLSHRVGYFLESVLAHLKSPRLELVAYPHGPGVMVRFAGAAMLPIPSVLTPAQEETAAAFDQSPATGDGGDEHRSLELVDESIERDVLVAEPFCQIADLLRREGGEGDDGQRGGELLLHPLGTLVVKQTVVPLNLDISRFGDTTPAGARRFTINSVSLNGRAQAAQPVKDFFAPAQFFEMSDDEKLSRPSFEPMPAGVTIGSAEIAFTADAGDWLEVEAIEFETWIVDKEKNETRPSHPEDSKNLYRFSPELLYRQARFGAAGSSDVPSAHRQSQIPYDHGEALTAVVKELQAERVDKILCTGDIIGYAAEPRPCIEIIRDLDCTIVAGDHDYAAVGKFPSGYFHAAARDAIVRTAHQLTSEYTEFLKNLPLVEEFNDITLVHASLNHPEFFDYITTGTDAG